MEGDKLTHISFIKTGKASLVLPNYRNQEYVQIQEGHHLGLMDIAFRILHEQQTAKDKTIKREKKRKKMHDRFISSDSTTEDDEIDSFAVLS